MPIHEIKDSVDVMFDAIERATNACHDLGSLSNALYRIGLTALAEEIAEIKSDIHGSIGDMRTAYVTELSGRSRDAENSLKELVGTALHLALKEAS